MSSSGRCQMAPLHLAAQVKEEGESHKSSQLDLPWFTYIFDGLWLCLLALAFKLAGVVWLVGGERSLWVGLKEGRRAPKVGLKKSGRAGDSMATNLSICLWSI